MPPSPLINLKIRTIFPYYTNTFAYLCNYELYKDHTFLLVFLSSTGLHAQNAQECEDTCRHIHGIDLSHYQGNVFWEAVGASKMAYVYLKATEGGTRVDEKYKANIDMAHRYGLKVGSYHFYRPKVAQQTQLDNFRAQCRPEDQDLLPMVDVETRGGLPVEAFRDSLFTFLQLMEKPIIKSPSSIREPISMITICWDCLTTIR